MTFEEFSEKWERDLKKLYWTDLDKFDNPKDFSKQITRHEKDQTFYNTSPAISPNGERMAYISAPEGVFGVYVTDLDNPEEYRKVVSSFRQQDFEDLNVLTPGISWNPEGTRLAISAKSGGEDAVFLVDVEEENYIKKTFGLKSITSVEWSPDGEKLVFVGVVDEDSDLFIYNLDTDSLRRITNDLFSDQYPSWSPDSESIYFISDRGNNLVTDQKAVDFEMWDYDIGQSDIYRLDYMTGDIRRITDSPQYGKTSVVAAPDGRHVLYTSSQNGIGNIYMENIETGNIRPLTNSITGITQLSLSPDGSKLLFATQIKGAYDIFLLRYPMDRNLDMDELPLTTYREQLIEKQKVIDELAGETAEDIAEEETESMEITGYGDFQIDFGRQRLVEPNDEAAKNEKLSEQEAMKDGAGDTSFVVHDYKIKFTPDVIVGNPGYSTYWGFQGVTQMLFSDILGNHQIYFQANLFRDLLNSSFFFAYNYLPEIIDYQFSANHQALFVYLDNYLYRFRNWGGAVSAWYPFDLFNRLEFGMNWINVSRENVDIPDSNDASRMLFVPQARYVHDDVLWGMFAPRKGTRYYLSLKGTPKFSDAGLGFMTVDFDYRRYFELSSFLHLAMRGSAGASIGPDPQQFHLGGTQNWINREFKNGELPFKDPEDFAFMQFAMPMRGYPVAELSGDKYFLANVELRFPLFRALLAGPVPVLFQSVQGSLFLDVGGAWSDVFRSYQQDAAGNVIDRDLLMSTGIGVRTLVIGLPLKMDVAWRNEYTGWSQPQYLFSLGLDF
jgi:Tol biopolymer transport system component